jgi:hypothetical protein
MKGERVAVVSCHVERPLDDEVWARFAALQRRRPGGFPIAALIRPADTGAGEDEELWLERAREAAAQGPLGQHTHWTAPDHARPTDGDTAERVLAEGRRLRELGLESALFCGGGWYTDSGVAEACAELGYVDCTPRASRPPYLGSGERWASLAEPTHVVLPSGRRLLVLPTTHSLGDLGRDLYETYRPRRHRSMPHRVTDRDRGLLPPYVHVYFHDTDLLDRRRAGLLRILLSVLARRAQARDLDDLALERRDAPERGWADVERL